MHVAKVVNLSVHRDAVGCKVFMAITKKIPDEPSADVVMEAIDILHGQKSHSLKRYHQIHNLAMCMDTSDCNWKQAKTWWTGGNDHQY